MAKDNSVKVQGMFGRKRKSEKKRKIKGGKQTYKNSKGSKKKYGGSVTNDDDDDDDNIRNLMNTIGIVNKSFDDVTMEDIINQAIETIETIETKGSIELDQFTNEQDIYDHQLKITNTVNKINAAATKLIGLKNKALAAPPPPAPARAPASRTHRTPASRARRTPAPGPPNPPQ